MDPMRFLGAASMGWGLIKRLAGHDQRVKARKKREEAEKQLSKVQMRLVQAQTDTKRVKGQVNGAEKQLTNTEKQLAATEKEAKRSREQLTSMQSLFVQAESAQGLLVAEVEQARVTLTKARQAEADANAVTK